MRVLFMFRDISFFAFCPAGKSFLRDLAAIISCSGRKGNTRGAKKPPHGRQTGKKHPPIRSFGEWGAQPLIGLSIGLRTSCFLNAAVRGDSLGFG